MAKISDLNPTTTIESSDLVAIVDASDTAMSLAGSNKKITMLTLAQGLSTIGNYGSIAGPTYSLATTTSNGLMSSEDKVILNDAAAVNGVVACDGNGIFSTATNATSVAAGLMASTDKTKLDTSYLFVPVDESYNPFGESVINYSANGSINTTPFNGATQTANLANAPSNAYMVLAYIRLNANPYSNTTQFVYIRKNSSATWRTAISLDPENGGEAEGQITLPIWFDRTTKSFQAYYHDSKAAGVPTTTPVYTFGISILGYFIK